jgi:hypothetical protein
VDYGWKEYKKMLIDSEAVTLSISSTLEAESAVFLPIHGARISQMDITSTPIVRRPYAVHPWNEIMPTTGRKILKLQLQGYFQASSGEALMQQHALSGLPCLIQLSESGTIRFQVIMHILRFNRLQQPTNPDTLRAELQSVGEVMFL